MSDNLSRQVDVLKCNWNLNGLYFLSDLFIQFSIISYSKSTLTSRSSSLTLERHEPNYWLIESATNEVTASCIIVVINIILIISFQFSLVCDKDWLPRTSNTLFWVGSIFGNLFFGWMSDRSLNLFKYLTVVPLYLIKSSQENWYRKIRN